MWSSEQETNTNTITTNNNRYSNRLVSSSSSSRSSPSCNSSIFPQTPRRRNLEEVWKDITHTTIHQERPMTPLDHYHHHHHHQNHHHHHHPHISKGNPSPSPSFGGMILQDFLAGPLNRPLPAVEELPLPRPPVPLTALSLSSGLEFNYMGSPNVLGRLSNPHPNSNSSSGDSRIIGRPAEDAHGVSTFVSDAHLFSFCSKKRLQERSGNGGDRRHKRMIKNRESAARSRARKQAYTNELELEVAHLLEENSKLKKQHEELRMAMATQIPTRNSIQRSSSSSF
ncbi:bZIP transcription factor 27 [Typha latifolia]|uniref:bZIP transcription factor 27 n=1 Tax=Typha latifolia TaxID=4733 RepID=UPI003C2FF1A3